MKTRSMLFIILLCSSFNLFGVLIATAENETQSPEEIAQIHAENEEYNRTHPKPKTPPPHLASPWREVSTDGKSLDFRTVQADNKMVVYMDKKTNTYHTGRCKYYEEKSGGDYSNPRWLADIVMDGTRCTLCISDEIYHRYREAIYRKEIEELSESNLLKKVQYQLGIIIILSVVCGIFFISISIFNIKLIRHRKQYL